MANTYTQIHIHAVFAVRNRLALITPSLKEGLKKYIAGITRNHNHKLLIINGVADHIHMLFGMRPDESISEFMKSVKASSSKWINQNRLTSRKFFWQEGFGAFSHSMSELPRVIRYIENQEVHHHKKPFLQEYEELLDEHKIEYDQRFVFKPVS
ncbi:MAG: IS200/IS605 family transposase [Cyclobacteriaceae bacterium]|nr:IS200/IS605 family transposase [Cyclobacteriaceae bacterium]